MEKGAKQADKTRRPATTDQKKASKQQHMQQNPNGRPWQQTKAALRVVPEERLKEIEAQIAAFAVDESRTEPLAFPASLPSHERKVVHRLAEEYNLSHESFGLGKERHIQVSKQPDVKERTLETLSISMKRRFVKDFDIPIKCFDPEDFRYFMDLYDREMQAHAKLNVMLEEIKNQGGEAAFHKFYFNTKEKIVQALSSSEAFAKFARDDSFLAPAEQEKLPASIYEPSNVGKYYLSLDIRSANFNALRFYDPSIVHGYETWEDLLKDHFHVTSPYLLAVKELRSVVFHDTCPVKVNAVNHWRICRLHRYLDEQGALSGLRNENESVNEAKNEKQGLRCYNNNDELLVEADDLDQLRRVEAAVTAAINSQVEKQREGQEDPLLKGLPNILRIQCFRLGGLPNPAEGFKHLTRRMFVKELLGLSSGDQQPTVTAVEFKGVPPTHFAVCWKRYHGVEEVNERDLKFWNEFADAYQHLVLLPVAVGASQ